MVTLLVRTIQRGCLSAQFWVVIPLPLALGPIAELGADLVALATGSGAGAAIGLWAAAAVSASAVYPLVILGAGPLGFFIGGLKKSFNVAK